MRMKRVCSILLMTAVLLCLLSVGVSAEETMATHSHPICGSRCCCGSFPTAPGAMPPGP